MRRILILTTAGLLSAATAAAEVVVDQPYDGTSDRRTATEILFFEDFSTFQLDDFSVDRAWNLSTLTAYGEDASADPNNTDVVAEIWTGLPGGAPCGQDGALLLSTSGQEDSATATLTFDFEDALLPAGQYWLRVYVVRGFGDHSTWGWFSTTPVADSEAYYYNPGGGLGFGDCPIPGSERYGPVRDLAFRLEGASVVAPCLGDLDDDLFIGLSDLGILLSNYGETSGVTMEDGDLNGDGVIDLVDLATLLSVYDTSCLDP